MLEEKEIRAIAQRVVDEAKSSAHVDTGFLKRSIYYIYVRGVVQFKQVFYGIYNDNSELEQIAKRLMPSNVPYILILTDEDGKVFLRKTQRASGRTSRSSITNVVKTSSKNITALITRIRNGKKKEKGADKVR